MKKNVNLKFTRDRYYNGKLYKTNEIAKMTMDEAKPYLEYHSGIIVNPVKKLLFSDMTYKALQKLCKDKNIDATGKKEELIKKLETLKLKSESNVE